MAVFSLASGSFLVPSLWTGCTVLLRKVALDRGTWREAWPEAGATLGTVGSGKRQNLALSCGVKARVGDNKVERLEFGDRPATGPMEGGEGGLSPTQGDDSGWSGWGREGRTVGPPREVEDSGGKDDVPPAHSPPHMPLLTRFWVHNPRAGPPLPPPLCSRGSPLAPAPLLASPGHLPGAHPAALSCGVCPPGKLYAPPVDGKSPSDTLRETLDHCPLCATAN